MKFADNDRPPPEEGKDAHVLLEFHSFMRHAFRTDARARVASSTR